mgnify:CR=1 FL=1
MLVPMDLLLVKVGKADSKVVCSMTIVQVAWAIWFDMRGSTRMWHGHLAALISQVARDELTRVGHVLFRDGLDWLCDPIRIGRHA